MVSEYEFVPTTAGATDFVASSTSRLDQREHFYAPSLVDVILICAYRSIALTRPGFQFVPASACNRKS